MISEDEIQGIQDNVHSILSHNFDTAKDYKAEARDWLSSFWAGFNSPSQTSRIRNTGVPMEFLKEVCRLPQASDYSRRQDGCGSPVQVVLLQGLTLPEHLLRQASSPCQPL